MLALTVYFSVIVVDLVSSFEPIWDFYILLYKMLDVLLSKSISTSSICYLKTIIEEHHKLYCTLFEQVLKPKFHTSSLSYNYEKNRSCTTYLDNEI